MRSPATCLGVPHGVPATGPGRQGTRWGPTPPLTCEPVVTRGPRKDPYQRCFVWDTAHFSEIYIQPPRPTILLPENDLSLSKNDEDPAQIL